MSAFQENMISTIMGLVSYPFKKVYRLFISHPKENKMTYREHLLHALHLSYKMWRGSVSLFIHAFFPFVLEKSGSNMIKQLYLKTNTTPISVDMVVDDVKDI